MEKDPFITALLFFLTTWKSPLIINALFVSFFSFSTITPLFLCAGAGVKKNKKCRVGIWLPAWTSCWRPLNYIFLFFCYFFRKKL
jgi:hypothetical protein